MKKYPYLSFEHLISPWETDEKFLAIYEKVAPKTVVNIFRCYNLYQLTKGVVEVAGDVAEVGVYKGGTAKLIASQLPHKKVYLFDTFLGMPESNPELDIHVKGDFKDTSLASVAYYLADVPNVALCQGLFPETTVHVERNTMFSFVHVDCDIYSSVKACCEYFYPLLKPFGIMCFDDYGALSCPGAKKAVDEFFMDRYENLIYMPTGQCFFIKSLASSAYTVRGEKYGK